MVSILQIAVHRIPEKSHDIPKNLTPSLQTTAGINYNQIQNFLVKAING